jgi:hypothetical protein
VIGTIMKLSFVIFSVVVAAAALYNATTNHLGDAIFYGILTVINLDSCRKLFG